MVDPTLLTLKQVRVLVPLAPRTLRKYVSAGRFPKPVHCGGRVLWSREEVVKWVEEQLKQREVSA